MITPLTAEERAGIEPLDRLQQKRQVLMEEYAPLNALFSGGNSMWEAKRKKLLAHLRNLVRETLGVVKVSEAKIDDLGRHDKMYRDWIDESIIQKAKWVVLRDKIRQIDERIQRDNLLIGYVKAEMGLAR